MKETITKTERITLLESGIVYCKALNTHMGIEDAKENIRAVRDMAAGKRVPVFVDITGSGGITKEARAYLAGHETATIQVACALLVSSPLSRLIGNFFLGLNKTQFPTRLFQDEKLALEWLKTFL